ncbi:MAG: YkgJ family cysteine cluster protein [Desulfobacterales bacterium]|nr:YkgJ family cysteine cluster protein [Desulfobacterales bacterium]
MNQSEKKAVIMPERLGLSSKFKFECHKGLGCFTQCCRGINIILTPYDIIKLKNHLNMNSEDFLAVYTEPQLLEKTDLPVITLKLMDDEKKSCPFVKDEGCIIYSDRPSACRYYPVGVASLNYREDDEGFYFFIKEPHCLGFNENKEWTIESWRKDQGVDIHDDVNSEWADLIVRKRSFPPNIKLTDQSKQMFFMASYNIDNFKKFVFESSFLKRYEIEKAILEKINNDEIELLKFGLKWIKWLFYKIGDFKQTKVES